MKTSILNILHKRYPENAYVVMKEVSDAAGFNRSRSADYIVMGLWPSRGLAIEGIELKSFRSDWLNELKNPKKAENIFQYCDHFWLLTSDDTIAKLEEIPTTWGWLCIKGERIIVKKEAPKLSPIPISRNFLAAMLKRASDKGKYVHIDSIEDRIQQAKEKETTYIKRELERAEKELKEAKESISTFEEASGIKLNSRWQGSNNTEIGAAVRFIQNGGIPAIKDQLTNLEKTAKNILDKITNSINNI